MVRDCRKGWMTVGVEVWMKNLTNRKSDSSSFGLTRHKMDTWLGCALFVWWTCSWCQNKQSEMYSTDQWKSDEVTGNVGDFIRLCWSSSIQTYENQWVCCGWEGKIWNDNLAVNKLNFSAAAVLEVLSFSRLLSKRGVACAEQHCRGNVDWFSDRYCNQKKIKRRRSLSF